MAGNDQQAYTPAPEFSIDTNNPTVTDVTVSDTVITEADIGGGQFTVTVVFSEAMDTGTPPVLTFGEDVSATLGNPQPVWSNGDTTYAVTYDVADGNDRLFRITVDVSGSKDAAGNDQDDYPPCAEFTIYMESPEVYVDAAWTTLNYGDDPAGEAKFFGLDGFPRSKRALPPWMPAAPCTWRRDRTPRTWLSASG